MDAKQLIHEKGWNDALRGEFEKKYFHDLMAFLEQEKREGKIIYPPESLIFSAFNETSFDDVKVVIIGQDPYHGAGQANGLCFSVRPGIKNPPSLRNIFKELKDNVVEEIPFDGDLTHWAKQGVLLLNATLTVRANEAGSHQKKGWETFTDSVIQLLSDRKENLVFLLWGNYAQQKGKCIDEKKHVVLKAAHPSPLGAYKGFFGCKHFSKTNEVLKKLGFEEIHWGGDNR